MKKLLRLLQKFFGRKKLNEPAAYVPSNTLTPTLYNPKNPYEFIDEIVHQPFPIEGGKYYGPNDLPDVQQMITKRVTYRETQVNSYYLSGKKGIIFRIKEYRWLPFFEQRIK